MEMAIPPMRHLRLLLPALFVISHLTSGCAQHADIADRFEESSRERLDRFERILRATQTNHPEDMLDRLGESPVNGSYFRLDDHMIKARCVSRTGSTDPRQAEALSVDLRPTHNRFQLVDDSIRMTYHDGEYLVSQGNLDVPRSEIGEIEIVLTVHKGREMELAWSKKRLAAWNPAFNWSDVGRVALKTIPDGRAHRYRVNARTALRLHLDFGDSLRTLFLRPSDVDGDHIVLHAVRLLPRLSRFDDDYGLTYETLNKVMRPAVYFRGAVELAFQVHVPPSDPRFEVGLGLVDAGPAVLFEVSVRSESGKKQILNRTLKKVDRWRDQTVSLQPWAGQEVELVLRTRAPDTSVSLWSNPIVRGPPRERMNVIVLLEDCLRADHLSAYGYDRQTSPIKDAVAAAGTQFLHAYSQATKTRPSCPSFMTSMYPVATGVLNHEHMLHDKYLTLAEVLRHQGWETASFVQNGNAGPWAGLHQGFCNSRDATTLSGKTPQLYGKHLFSWLEKNRNVNFFAYIHALNPHGPYDPPAPFDSWYREIAPGAGPVKKSWLHDPDWIETATTEGRNALYDGEIRQNDHFMKSLLEHLEKSGLGDNTLLVIIADHGEHLGEHGLWEHAPPSYLNVVHVPLILHYPDRVPSGHRIEENVQLLDIMPTILDLAGIDPDLLLLQGDSLVPLMDDGPDDFWRNRVVWTDEGMAYKPGDTDVWASVFFRRWHVLHSRSTLPTKVFDLIIDPNETSSLDVKMADFISVVGPTMRRIHTVNSQIHEAVVSGREEVIDLDPDFLSKLRELGYAD